MGSHEAGARVTLVGQTIGTYRILEPIGHGGMGDVYRAWDDRLSRTVAVKVLPPSLASDPHARSRFLRETRVACRVVHPYVATVFDVLEQGEHILLVMEYIDGRPLDAVLREDRSSLREVTRIGLEIAEALGAIHQAGLVHRDLKPGNVMITPTGHVKVMDFGVALPLPTNVVSPDEGTYTYEPTLTSAGVCVGTISYMSPEQIRGQRGDPRSDLFSFGILLYEAVAGEHPFMRESALATASAILNEPPGRGLEPETLTQSGPVRNVVQRLLAKDPVARYQSAEDVLEDLRAISRGEAIRKWPGPSSWRLKLRPAMAAVAVAGLLVLATWVVSERWPGRRGGGVPSDGAGVFVLPFRVSGNADDAAIRGTMLASMLRIDLAQTGKVPVVGSARTDEMLGSSAGPVSIPAGGIRRMLNAMSCRFLVSGSLQRENDLLIAAVEVYDQQNPDRTVGFSAQAASLTSLTEEVGRGLREKLSSLPGAPPLLEAGAPIQTLFSPSESALLAAERGRQAVSLGSYSDAERYYAQAVSDDPAFVRAHIERARALYESGYVIRAREAVEQALREEKTAGRPLPERLRLEIKAIRCRVQEDRQGEERALVQLVKLYSTDPDGWAELSKTYAAWNKPNEGLQAIDEALKRSPAAPAFHLQRADLLRRMNRLDESENEISEAERLNSGLPGRPLLAQVLMQRGYLRAIRKEFAAARQAYLEAAESFSASGQPLRLANVNLSIAQTYLFEGNLKEANAPLEKAARDFAEAGAVRSEAICLDTLGALLFQAGHLSRAEPLLRRALGEARETGSGSPILSPLLNLASLLQRTGRTDESESLAGEALQLATSRGDVPRQATARLLLFGLKADRGNLREAEAGYLEVVSMLPAGSADERLGWAWSGIAEVRILEGQLASGLDAADRAIEVHRKSGQALNLGYALIWRARIRRLAGDASGFANDIEAAETPARESPDLAARCLLERALQKAESGDDGGAEKDLRAVLSASEVALALQVPARSELGVLLCRAGRTAEGLETVQRALKEARAETDRVLARADHATALALSGQPKVARDEGLRALAEAERAGMVWEVAQSAATLLSLGPAVRLANEASVRERGRTALQSFLDGAPAGAEGSISNRPRILAVKSVLMGT